MLPGFPANLSPRVWHRALESRDARNLRVALWKEELKQVKAADDLVQAVMESRVVASSQWHRYGLWRRLIGKFAGGRGNPGVEAGAFGLVVDAFALCWESKGNRISERLMGLPIRELASHACRHWRDLSVASGCLSEAWKRNPHARAELALHASRRWHPWLARRKALGSPADSDGWEWVVVELCSGLDLINEGRAMKHCVGGYHSRCLKGGSAVFSLRRRGRGEDGSPWEQRVATVEVIRCGRRIAQVRGRRNDTNHSQETGWALSEWARVNQLAW